MKNFVRLFVLSIGLVLGTAVSLYSQDFPEKDFKLSGGAVKNVKMKAVDGNFDKKATNLGIGAAKMSKVVPSTNGADGGEKGLSQQTEQQASSQQSAKQSESWTNNTGIFSRYHANKWTANGIYAGLTPEKEKIQYRTEHSKTFDNGDGTFSYMYIGDLHYQDEKGSWQDIDVSIKKENNNGYKYANTTNKFKTYYSDSPADGIMMNYEGQNLVFGKNYSFSFIDGQGNALAGQERTAANAKQDDFRTLSYKDFYRGIDYNMIQLGRGVETGFFVNNRSAVASGAKTVRVSQTVEMPDGAYIMADGHKQDKTFSASEFEIMIPGYESWITFQPVVVYDANVDMDYIMKRAEIRHIEDNVDKDGKPIEDPMDKYSYKAIYNVEQSGNTLTVSFDLPAEWLLAADRAYPVFVDPTVTVLTGSTSVTSSYTFYNTLYHDSRWDVQILGTELPNNFTNGTIVSALGLLCSAAPGRTVEYARIDLNNSAWSTTEFVTSGWTTCYSATSLATPTVSSSTWNTYTFSSNFTYSSANSNMLVRLSKDGSAWSSGGGNYCVSDATGTTARGGYQDSSDGYPFDGISSQGNACRPAMQLTYTARTIPVCGDCNSITFSDLGYANETNLNNAPFAICTNISVIFNTASGSYDPKYYTSGTAVRVYAGNTFTVSTTGSDPITSINITFGSGDGSSVISTNTGTFSNSSWTGSATSVTFSLANSGTNRRRTSIL